MSMDSPNAPWGAAPDDWAHFTLLLGLTADLLPVVSNPGATISPTSELKSIGKTPSRYNGRHEVTGIADWTRKITTDAEVSVWETEPDYGICIQTRRVRAVDIDVPDTDKARQISTFVETFLGMHLPMRARADSGKCLLAFELLGEFQKRVMKVDGGIVEFLANGQQFIAAGTNPSGARYEWCGGIPDVMPNVTAAQFEELWAALVEKFAVEAPRAARKPGMGSATGVVEGDPLADFIEENCEVRGYGRNGEIYIACPWKEEHSSDSGETETAYFRAGTGGYQLGHFRCLHAHCMDRTDAEFKDALGYQEHIEAFEVLSVVEESDDTWPTLERDSVGRVLPTMDNTVKSVGHVGMMGMKIGYDAFKDEIMLSHDGGTNWGQLCDEDYTRIRITLERRGFKNVPKELVRDAVLLVAKENEFDSAQLWLNGLVWDGVPRVESFLSQYLGTVDSPYTRAVGRYMWSAMAGRVLEPGVKADMTPILISAQGMSKTSMVEALVPHEDFFVEINLETRDDDISRRLRGKLVGEMAELRGLNSRDSDSIKAFISRRFEEWVPKYREFSVKFPRRLLLIGTTNQEQFLADETGERRYLPVKVGVTAPVGVAAVRGDRELLWAEAREMFKAAGVAFREAEELAREVHPEHKITDPWEEGVSHWLNEVDLTGEKPGDKEFLTTHEILVEALGFKLRDITKRDEMRVAKALAGLGYVKYARVEEGKRRRGWVKDDWVSPLQ